MRPLFAVVRVGTTKTVRLNDPDNTLLLFYSEIRAHRICRALNREAKQSGRLMAYEVIVKGPTE